MKKKISLLYIALATTLLVSSCKEQDIEIYDSTSASLNIAKGVFRPNEYPESYSFNAYFLGVGAGDYKIEIPVRLTGTTDYQNDREYRVKLNPEKSANATNGVEFSMDEVQTLKKGAIEDSITVTIHIAKLNEVDDYKLYIELVPNDNFIAGIPKYQFIEVDFMKNVNTAPYFWTANSKLKKFTYHPAKCAKFLEVSGITDPEWEDSGSSFALDYWIRACTQWFEDNEVTDDATGNRIYFNE